MHAIGHGLGHFGGEVIVRGVLEGVHAALDLVFRGAVAQGLLKRLAGGFKPAERIGGAAVF